MRRILALTIGVMTLASAACGGKDATGPASIAGTYILQTVNSQVLPVTTSQDETYKAEILAWSITLKDDLSWTHSVSFRVTEGGVTSSETLTSAGTYVLTGTSLRLTDPDGYLDLNLTGNTMTMVIEESAGKFTLVFKR